MLREILTDNQCLTVLASKDFCMNLLRLEDFAKIEAKTIQLGDFNFIPKQSYPIIGTGEYTSSGFGTVECLDGFTNVYEGIIGEWLLFSLLKDNKPFHICPTKKRPSLFDEDKQYRYYLGLRLFGR